LLDDFFSCSHKSTKTATSDRIPFVLEPNGATLQEQLAKSLCDREEFLTRQLYSLVTQHFIDTPNLDAGYPLEEN